jgi:hypothetical protein
VEASKNETAKKASLMLLIFPKLQRVWERPRRF